MLHVDMVYATQPHVLAALRTLAATDSLGDIRDASARVRMDDTTRILPGEELRDPGRLHGNVLGDINLRLASAADIALVPEFGGVAFCGDPADKAQRRARSRKLVDAFKGLHVVRVEPDDGPFEPAEVIVGYPFIRRFAVEYGLAKPEALMLDRVVDPAVINGTHVAGQIDWAWAATPRKVTEIGIPGVLNLPGTATQLQELLMGLMGTKPERRRSYRVADVPLTELL